MTGFLPHFRFLHPEAYEKPEQSRQSSNKKHRTPAPARKDKVETTRRQKIAESISLLQNARKKPAQPWRNLFHGERGTHAPLSAHADPEQSAQHQKSSETVRETRGDLDRRVKNQVDHQRNAASVTVGQQSENERAHGTKRQRQRNREGNLFVRPMKLLRDRRQREDDQEKVESVQRPPELSEQARSFPARSNPPRRSDSPP